MSISDWPTHDRPRERLIAHGASALSDAELLAIYLRVGVRGKSAVDLAQDLLQAFEGRLGALVEADIKALSAIPGIGIAKAAQLKASFELSRRALAQEMRERDNLGSPSAVRDWLSLNLGHRERETFLALWLDSQNRLIASEELFEGTINQAAVHPREVVKSALKHNAAAVILAHNHPSGIAEPSAADRMLTDQIKRTLEMIDVRLLDHLIVGGTHNCLSFSEQGLI